MIHKLGVVRTLLDRCDAIVSDPTDAKQEEQTIADALKVCGYPKWTFKKVRDQMEIKKAQLTTNKKQKKDKGEKSRGHIVIPYMRR